MISIEQAVFTSAETDRSTGYQVVATSPGVCPDDVRELTVWGPSHDAMLRPEKGATSVNFHPLPSGAFCVSRTMPAGAEYSGRRGPRIYTQCLVVSPQTLDRFANNPFALLKAVSAGGSLRAYDTVPKHLAPLRLVGRAAVVDEALLGRLRRDPGPRWMATVLQAALNSPALALAGDISPERVIAGLINCLPPECRTEFSFSTGLKLSSRRPFRVVALPAESDEQRRATRLYDLNVLNLTDEPPSQFTPTDSWPRLVQRVLEASQVSFLSRYLSDHREGCSLHDLPALGLQMLEELDTALLAQDPARPESCPDETTAPAVSQSGPLDVPAELGEPRPRTKPPSSGQAESVDSHGSREYRRGHEPHERFQADTPPSTPKHRPAPPSKAIDPDSAEMMEDLRRLDGLVDQSMSGSSDALDELKSLWFRLRTELDAGIVTQAREQYLRYALAIWKQGPDPAHSESDRQPAGAIQALDVLCVIFDEV